ncbi:CNH domain-containing protein [Cunninghamella echinulata]|nr:CNH domain-containing protein [Cunninghamella echinulata]
MKRQECIYELIYTEADFVEDLQYVHNFWVKPLITQDIIADEQREHFVQEVFWNMADIEKVNGALSQALTTLQKENYIVSSIGEVLMAHVTRFDPFVAYGAHQIIGKFKFELEKKRNPTFAQFVQTTERLPESRRLELNGYLTKPTTRLGRYNLLLREILKRTPEDNPDYHTIPKVMDIITNYLVQVNSETGKCENIFNLQQLEERMSFKTSTVHVDLELRNPQRQLIMQGRMKRKENTTSESSDLQVLLFDHYLVIAKIKYHDHLEYYKVNRQPIPLELLTITTSQNNLRAKRASTILAYRSSTIQPTSQLSLTRAATAENLLAHGNGNSNNSKSGGAGITFYHHGHKGSPPITLFVSSTQARKSWVEHIQKQQDILKKKRSIFTIRPLVCRQFLTSNRVQDTIIMKKKTKQENGFSESKESLSLENAEDIDEDGTYTMIVGTDMGIYVGTVISKKNRNNSHGDENSLEFSDDDDNEDNIQCSTMQRVISLDKVSHIELMEDSQLLVLAEKTLWTFPLDEVLDPAIDNNNNNSNNNICSSKSMIMKKGRTISTNTSFFYVGECMGKLLVCIVKPNTLATTTIRVMEPIATDDNKKAKTGFSIRRLVRNGPVGLKPYKDLYLPSEALSISLLKSKMCISCPREIGVVDMKSFGVQTLLDPEDEDLAFVFSRQDIRPITIYRVQFAEYLVCYDAFGFFVDQRGRWIRSSRILEWEGTPTSFALSYPYVIAFEPGFIEIRNLNTGAIDQLIRGVNIRCTNIRHGMIQGSMNDPDNDGYQIIFQLDRVNT